MAEASGLPWATWCPFPLPLSAPEVPPFGPGLSPARGPSSRVRDAILRPIITNGYARAFVPAVNQVRAQVGLPPLSEPAELYERAPLVLYMTAEPFECPRARWSENIVLIAPCAWEPPIPAPAWLEDIDRPIVLITTSSEFQNDAKLVSCAMRTCT